jgi:hypothetical protein
MPKNIFLITAIVVVIVVGATSVYLNNRREGGEEMKAEQPVVTSPERAEEPVILPEKPITTTEPIDTFEKTYRNQKYGFELKYPREFVMREGSEAKYPSGALFPPGFFIGPPTVRIDFPESEYQDSNLRNASLSVHVYEQPEALTKCSQGIYSWQQLSKTENINGVDFYKDYWEEGGMGHRYEVSSYRTIRQKTCYEINLVIYWSSLTKETRAAPFDKERIQRILARILSTFHFTK